MPLNSQSRFFECFSEIEDPRVDRSKLHDLCEILFIVVVAFLSNANDFASVERFARARILWLRRFLRLANGVPSHNTFNRVIGMLDPAQLEACIFRWLSELSQASNGRFVAIDGKTLRRSFDRATGTGALQLVSAFAAANGVVLGQVAVDEASNEIEAIPRLVELLQLDGAIVTIDAAGCQKNIAADLVAKRADYVLAVKGNQPALHEAVATEFERLLEDGARELKTCTEVEQNSAGVEERRYHVAPAPTGSAFYGWKNVRSIGMVVRVRTSPDGAVNSAVRYYISSLEPKVKRFAAAVRGHWRIETTLHWSLDVTFAEDGSRLRKDDAARNAAAFRRLTLSLLKLDTSSKDNLKGKRKTASWSLDALEALILGFSKK